MCGLPASRLKQVLACFVLAFVVFAGDAQGQSCPYPLPSPSPTDQEILRAFYCATDGDNWTNNDNWLSGMPLGDWHGVSISGGQVLRLNLAENNLRGDIPPELGNLPRLWTLDLSENELTGSIPTELQNLSNLRTLDLSGNGLTGSIPSELQDLSNLRTLNLSENELTGSIPSELQDLSNLRTLNLSENELTEGIPTELGQLPELVFLFLERSGLTGGIPTELRNLTVLLVLDLSGNELTGGVPTELQDMSSLRSLDLSENELSGSVPPELENFPSLRRLNLSENGLTGGVPTELGNMTELDVLNLSGNELTGGIPTELGNMTELDVLNLSGNGLTGVIPPELGNLAALERLDLSENGLTGSIPSELGNLIGLEELYLDNNQLSGMIPECSSLSGCLSGCNVRFSEGPELEISYLGNNPFITALLAERCVPKCLSECPFLSSEGSPLRFLYLHNNQLGGKLPFWLVHLTEFELWELGVWGNERLSWHNVYHILGQRMDRAALRFLYLTNGGVSGNWTREDNWLPSSGDIFSFSSWYGVSADSDSGRVSELNLENNGLSGELTNAVEVLGGLESLDISDNRGLGGQLPLRLRDDLPLLERLDIRCTDISAHPANTDFQDWLEGIDDFQQGCVLPPERCPEGQVGIPPNCVIPSSPPRPRPQPQLSPGQVTGVEVVAGVEQLSVSWDPVNDADGYRVQWKSGSQRFDSSREHRITNADITTYTIPNLIPGTEYTARVIATRSGADDGIPSLEVTGTPEFPEVPEVIASGSGGGCAIVSERLLAADIARSTLLNLLLLVSAPFLIVFRKKL